MKTAVISIVCTVVAMLGLFQLVYTGYAEGWRQGQQDCPKAATAAADAAAQPTQPAAAQPRR
jgi:hypothetical protein